MQHPEYSTQTRQAARLLGLEVARRRRELSWTAAELAERAGISRDTLRKVERGHLGVALGTAFEVATLVGVRLFGAEPAELGPLVRAASDRLTVLPQRVRQPSSGIDVDF